jgi:hypothetical protein
LTNATEPLAGVLPAALLVRSDAHGLSFSRWPCHSRSKDRVLSAQGALNQAEFVLQGRFGRKFFLLFYRLPRNKIAAPYSVGCLSKIAIT